MSANSDKLNETSKQSSFVKSSNLVTNPVIKSGVLRPSVLASSLNATTNETEEAAKEDNQEIVKNPFLEENKSDDAEIDSKSTAAESIAAEKNEQEEADERPDPLKLLSRNGLERSKYFSAARKAIPRVEKSGFVFGENVHERVVGENILNDTQKKILGEGSTVPAEFLFSSVIQKAEVGSSSQTESAIPQPKEIETKSLTDVAREYEESRGQKRKYEEVETFTGEEDETNIVDVSCKLFAFVNSNWEERGRGCLRLNDSKKENECSRVVFRTSGNLRLLVNTKVWAGMVAERSSQKSLRITAMDNTGQIKVFLLMARPGDINLLYKALTERINLQKYASTTSVTKVGNEPLFSEVESHLSDGSEVISQEEKESTSGGKTFKNKLLCGTNSI